MDNPVGEGDVVGAEQRMTSGLNDRARDVLKLVVEAFVESGEPVGSRTIARKMEMSLSAATIRNVMADLEDLGLLHAPHTSAGRMPTEAGLRLFVDGLLQIGHLTKAERAEIEARCAGTGKSLTQVMEEASDMMSGLSSYAGLVFAPKQGGRLRHIEFVPLGPGRALVVLVSESGMVENRVIDLPRGLPPSALIEASNYLAARLVGKTLDESRLLVREEVDSNRAQLDKLTAKVVETGMATWSEISSGDGVLIVRGQANLLEEVGVTSDLEHIRALFSALESKENLLRLLDAADIAEGVQIFIGAENDLFSMAGWSMIVAPYADDQERVVGAIGVLGPMRMNYSRIIPMVDYTSRVVGRLLSGSNLPK